MRRLTKGSSRASTQTLGIGCQIASGASFALSDAVSKLLTAKYPTGEILFFQAIVILSVMLVGIRVRTGAVRVRVNDWRRQLTRGAIFVVNGFVFVTVVRHLPLADLMALMFLTPILGTLLAPRLLGERVGWRRYAAVAVGFGGTLLIVDPSGKVTALWPTLLALVIPVLGSYRDIVTRQLSVTDRPESMMVVSACCLLVASSLTLPFAWIAPDAEGLGMLAVTGLFLGGGIYLQIYAFTLAEVVTVAPFRYFILIWATIYGFALFGDVPSLQTVAGAGVVVASGLYIFFRQVRHR